MRRGNNPQMIVSDGSKFLGVSLGADYAAEHEWGIREIMDAFDLNADPAVFGIDRRIIRRVPEEFEDFSLGKTWGFSYMPYGKLGEYVTPRGELNGVGLRGAWDNRSFGVVSDVTTAKKNLRTLYKEFRKKNGVITMVSGSGIISNPGLCLAIADRIPENVRNIWLDADTMRYEALSAMKDSGIEELLKAHVKSYWSLYARKFPDGSIKYWLNPRNDGDNHGWYTLEELQQWAGGYGPIPKKPVRVS